MQTNPDFKELLSLFDDEKVEYLIVGAHAVMFYTEPRYTKDMDIWINPTIENAQRVYAALQKFGAPLAEITLETFLDPNMVYQMGVAPNRIDILMGMEEMDFASAWTTRSVSTYEGVPINILGRDDLIRNKKAAGRAQDLLDAARLEQERR